MSLHVSYVLAGNNDCQPVTWGAKSILGVGQVNCRYKTNTKTDVNSDTCKFLINKYEITMDKLLELNPELDKGCTSIKPNTEYCVKGCK